MKNLYRILQVDPEADEEIIEAAYKRLMRKYHPDRLSPEERADQSLLEKVQDINEAYAILSDAEKRREYDKTLEEEKKPKAPANLSVVEKRIYWVKCAISKQPFRMLLARKKGAGGMFKILGFESTEECPPQPPTGNWLVRVSRNFLSKPKTYPQNEQVKSNFPSDADVDELFSEENVVSIKDVDWTGDHRCPACKSEFVRPDAVLVQWLRCGSCSHLFCVGTATRKLAILTSKCPWCGKTNRIELSSSKPREELIIGGREFTEFQGANQNLLPGKNQKTLGDGKR